MRVRARHPCVQLDGPAHAHAQSTAHSELSPQHTHTARSPSTPAGATRTRAGAPPSCGCQRTSKGIAVTVAALLGRAQVWPELSSGGGYLRCGRVGDKINHASDGCEGWRARRNSQKGSARSHTSFSNSSTSDFSFFRDILRREDGRGRLSSAKFASSPKIAYLIYDFSCVLNNMIFGSKKADERGRFGRSLAPAVSWQS